MAWLARRQPEKWRERKAIDLTGTIEHRLSQMTPAERIADAEALAQRVRDVLREAGRTTEGEAGERARCLIDHAEE